MIPMKLNKPYDPEVKMGGIYQSPLSQPRFPVSYGNSTPAMMQPQRPIASYKKGTDKVPKTGLYKLHEGEAVLDKESAEEHRARKGKMNHPYDAVKDIMGSKEDKPKKEIKEIHHRKGHGGKGHILTHKHTHPEHHPDEEHVATNDSEMLQHMMQNAGNGDGSADEMMEAAQPQPQPQAAAQ